MLHFKIDLPSISAGFPSPADDYLENNLSLDELIIKNKSATFFVRVEGDSMINAGIHPNDLLVIDRSISPTAGQVIIAILDGEFTVKRLVKEGKGYALKAENPHYKNIPLNDHSNFMVWGIVIAVFHNPNHL